MSRSSSHSSTQNEPFSFSARTSSNLSVNVDANAIVNNLTNRASSAQSLLSARRPSWTPSLSFRDVTSDGASTLAAHNEHVDLTSQASSPEDGGNFRRSLQIDNKGLVGDAVGNMSISPSSRDVVLAARRGLFIIDLEAPLEVPRFLPQGGTWDVADVQWNPHHSRAEYIVSTSSEKLLIWNLLLVGKTSIEHILRSHYRAITDINWHTTEPDMVVSTGIDAWLWSWDLRQPEKPVFGLSAFNAGGTQVKWNRQDPHVLASSHLNEVLIWDRRKGSLPISRIRAHNAKIYGIDWSHERRNEIVTCSLDKTIKVWDVHASPEEQGGARECPAALMHIPSMTIETNYPVWRARDLPFGRGLLSLPQRGETSLEMFAYGDEEVMPTSVEVFEGHSDVVKEFVWRKGGRDGGEYQLITWSKDRTLRFWPVDSEVMQKVGHSPERMRGRPRSSSIMDNDQSFRVPPEGNIYPPTISAPVGHRGILAEVRAQPPPRISNPVLHPHHGSAARAHSPEWSANPLQTLQSANTVAIPTSTRQGGTMSRGNVGGKSAKIEMITWMKNVKEVSKREGSSGSGADSGSGSRLSSRSRNSSAADKVGELGGKRRRSDSRNRGGDDQKERDNQSLQAEITSVIAKLETLAQTRIRLEKHDLTKKRTCTLGLYGPWGGSSSVFVRVSFTFPKDYPQAQYPRGIPTLELERSPLVSMKDRAFILRRLKAIRERRRPCLEPCLRFLLFGNEDEKGGRGPVPLDSDSSSEDEERAPVSRKSRDLTVTLLRSHKNLAEPRTSQGIFAPNGALVCFFRAPPHIVRNLLQNISVSPSAPSRSPEVVPRLFQSPALLSDAVRRLGLSATDRTLASISPRRTDDGPENILRIMTNLLTFSQQKFRRDSDSKPLDEIPASYSLIPMRRSTVYIMQTVDAARMDKKVAGEYIFESDSLSELCDKNARVASAHLRYDHARVFRVLQTLFPTSRKNDVAPLNFPSEFGSLAHEIVSRLYAECSSNKDVQILAMVSIILLRASRMTSGRELPISEKNGQFQVPLTPVSKFPGGDYFSLSLRGENRHALPATSPTVPRPPPSPIDSLAGAVLSTSNSSRASWSSLFNTGSVRQFMSGMQDTLKDGLSTPTGDTSTAHRTPINVPGHQKSHQEATSPRHGTDSSQHLTRSISKSWGDNPVPSSTKAIPFFSAGHVRRSTFSQAINPRVVIPEKKLMIFDETAEESDESGIHFEPELVKQFMAHILVYANILFGWQLFHKRVELFKSVDQEMQKIVPSHLLAAFEHKFGVIITCEECGSVFHRTESVCPSCANRSKLPQCSICRLPAKGLSRMCPRCLHVTHVNCWNFSKIPFCATGCGCACFDLGLDIKGQDPSHFLRSPQSVVSALPSYM